MRARQIVRGRWAPVLLLLVLCAASLTHASEYRAFSMAEAERLLRAQPSGLRNLGGITRLVACVFDEELNDLILIGQVDPAYSEISIDHFVVAMRAVLKHREAPLVSIDPAPPGDNSREQPVRFAGHIENTQFGKDLLDADVVLKKLGLGKASAELWGVRSYFDLSAEEWQRTGNEEGVLSRFWFMVDPTVSAVAARKGVGIVKQLKVEVRTDTAVPTRTSRQDPVVQTADPIGSAFATAVTNNLDDVVLAMPELRRLDQLYRLVAVASVIQKWQENFGLQLDRLDYWLSDAPVQLVTTRSKFPLLSSIARRDAHDGESTMTISGGIELKALVADVAGGSLSALRDLVLRSRPRQAALTWAVPIRNALDDIVDVAGPYPGGAAVAASNAGMNLKRIYSSMTHAASMVKWNELPLASIATASMRNAFPIQNVSVRRRAPDVGGVMLENVASVTDDGMRGPLDMANARFSFVVDGQDARLDPLTYRKFVTALWSVYYAKEDPGISIDPIAPGAEKHLVRYIGRVINTDLGRVMREADYLMKQWAVGTDSPDIDAFRSPMEYAADTGMLSLGAWSRFWFVPQDMRFRRAGNMLLFEGGRMTVQTEFMHQGIGSGADPAHRRFATFFTENYAAISAKYPVFKELYEYAKMVSLAMYLKESGVPLFWFLMANKELVITEDSVSTVDALVKNSSRFTGVYVEGGVELYSERQYIYDDSAVAAISDALDGYSNDARAPAASDGKPSRGIVVGEPVSFTVNDRKLSVLPQHSGSASKDFRGVRYQTDIALRESGYQLTQKSLGLLQHEIFRWKYAQSLKAAADEDGNFPEGQEQLTVEDSWNKATIFAAEIAGNLQGLLNRDFKSSDRFQNALSGFMSKTDFDTWTNLITKFAFYNTTLELVRHFRPEVSGDASFGVGWDLLVPYKIRAMGDETVEFQGWIVPKQMALIDTLTQREEILTFDADKFTAAAYTPGDITSSQIVGLLLMTDGSYRMLDKIENKFTFDVEGRLVDMLFSDVHKIHFNYEKDHVVKPKRPPYKIESAGGKWIRFRSMRLPESLIIRYLSGDEDRNEILTFTDKRAIVGYEPADVANSDFELLALMSDLSYRLVDKNSNEMLFDASGEFQEMIFSSEEPIVSSISSGNYSIDFDYTLNSGGKAIVSKASLQKDGEPSEALNLSYEYGSDGQLARIVRFDHDDASDTTGLPSIQHVSMID